jgi:hypothetical protein
MTISAGAVRYIKMGRGGRWEDAALDRGELHFGYKKATHELALEGNFEKLKEYLIGLGRDAQPASRDAREVLDFYELGADCLWITFAKDHLWWAFAAPEVTWIGGDGQTEGERTRKAIGGWRNTDLDGIPLRTNTLSTKLTKVANYRRTICKVEAQDYLLRRINGIQEPFIEKSTIARDTLIMMITEGLTILHWADFETLVDVMFARSGWHRASAIGGNQKLVDMEIEQPTTSERGAVQVKSSASQKTLDQYIARIDEAERFDRFFFVCHSPEGELTAPTGRNDIHVWVGRELASTVLRLGLQDWVFEKAVQL